MSAESELVGEAQMVRLPSVARLRTSTFAWATLGIAGLSLPYFTDAYWAYVASRILVYWIIVAGLNLMVGFAGQLAVGYVAVLAVGAYASSATAHLLHVNPFVAILIGAGFGAAAGAIVGVPALRLRTFYFAMATLGATQIVIQIAFAWTGVTGGGGGLPGPVLPAPFDSALGFYSLCVVFACAATWLTTNIVYSRFGRALVAVRDAEVAAESCGVFKAGLLIPVFLLAGALAGVAGALFASLQTHITPEAFSFDLSILFFIAVLVGGRGSVVGPALAVVLLTILPEIAAPLAAWSTFIHAVLLLLITLVLPGGVSELIEVLTRRTLPTSRSIASRPELIRLMLGEQVAGQALRLRSVAIQFGALRAVDDLDLDLRPGEIHGLIGPNGSGKTTTLNAICGFVDVAAGSVTIGNVPLPASVPQAAPRHGIARTFQTPRVIGDATVLDNILVGGTVTARSGFFAAMLKLPRQGQEEKRLRNDAMLALRVVGLEHLADVRASRLQHSELRFVEIARALMLKPRFLLLDEPAAGLAKDEIRRLAEIVRQMKASGVGILLIEHHADFIFDVCDRVTVLNLGRTLASGTPDEVRQHKGVINAYLGV